MKISYEMFLLIRWSLKPFIVFYLPRLAENERENGAWRRSRNKTRLRFILGALSYAHFIMILLIFIELLLHTSSRHYLYNADLTSEVCICIERERDNGGLAVGIDRIRGNWKLCPQSRRWPLSDCRTKEERGLERGQGRLLLCGIFVTYFLFLN